MGNTGSNTGSMKSRRHMRSHSHMHGDVECTRKHGRRAFKNRTHRYKKGGENTPKVRSSLGTAVNVPGSPGSRRRVKVAPRISYKNRIANAEAQENDDFGKGPSSGDSKSVLVKMEQSNMTEEEEEEEAQRSIAKRREEREEREKAKAALSRSKSKSGSKTVGGTRKK